MKEDINILIITGGNPENKSAAENTNKILKILLSITDNIHLISFCNKELISGLDNKKIHSLRYYKNRFQQFLCSQILVSKEFISLSRTNNIKLIIFAFGQDLQLIPLILAKLTSKKIVIRSDGRPTIILKKHFKTHSPVKRFLFRIIEEINYRLADIVLTECEYMISENEFQKYNTRNGSLFVDTNKFRNRIKLDNRTYEIGFIGRLSKEKGILNFLNALALVKIASKVVIIGDGEVRGRVLDEIQLLEPMNKLNIECCGWVENDKLPDYLNEIKLLVVPSYKEGLPNIILEAMACGTPVLAMPVGGIPGVIKDGKTGFIMENNTPEGITENVMRALEHSDLERIVENARALVEKEFTYETAVERYKRILVL